MAMGRSNVGENVPLVTSPTISSLCSTGQPWRGTRLPSQLQADADGLRFVGGESFEGVAADELAAAEIHGEVEAGLDRVDGFGQFVAVERHRGFEAERVAGTEAGGHAADACGVDKFVPRCRSARSASQMISKPSSPV